MAITIDNARILLFTTIGPRTLPVRSTMQDRVQLRCSLLIVGPFGSRTLRHLERNHHLTTPYPVASIRSGFHRKRRATPRKRPFTLQ